MSSVSPMCEDEGRCLIYTMSRTAAIHCLRSWDIYQTKAHISQTHFPPSPFSFFFLAAQHYLEPYLRPPYHDVHKGATDPKTTAEKLSLQQLRPPSGAQNQHSHRRQLLLEAVTDSVSLSTVFKNGVNFKPATDTCLQPQDYICKKWILLLLFLMMVAQMRITGLWEIQAMLPQTIFPPPHCLCKVLDATLGLTVQNFFKCPPPYQDMVSPTLNSDLSFALHHDPERFPVPFPTAPAHKVWNRMQSKRLPSKQLICL